VAREDVTVATSVTTTQFAGPLPPPEMLAEYNRITPGAAERILKMAEMQQVHRHSLEISVVRRNLEAQIRGQFMAFGVSVLVIAGGFGLIAFGKDAYGIAAVIGALTSLVIVFVTGRLFQARERREKRHKAGDAVA